MKVSRFFVQCFVLFIVIYGLTVSAHSITIAVSQRDTINNEVINTYDYNGTQVGSIGLDGYVSDIEYDSAGNLFSYTSTGLWMYDGISNTKISTITADTNYGGDITISSLSRYHSSKSKRCHV